MNKLAVMRLLMTLSFRNLFSHSVKTLIVGSIMLFGTFLVVLGTALLDSVEQSMSEGITSSLAGHIQVYSRDAKDELALFGGQFMGAEDVGRIGAFHELRTALEGVNNIKAVVPMGVDMATVTSVGALERTLADLRKAVQAGAQGTAQELVSQVKEILLNMKEERKNRSALTRDKKKLAEELARLEKARGEIFWSTFEESPLDVLEYLDTQVAPLSAEGRLIYFRYLGTDLTLFQKHFDRFEIVTGQPVPPHKRGFLFNQKFYDDWVKHYVARNLDKLYRGVTEEDKSIAEDPILQALARQTARQHQRITYQLDPEESSLLRRKLREYFQTPEANLTDMITRFLSVDDDNIRERYRIFYQLFAPLIDLYDIDVGEVMTIRAFTRSGYLKAVNVKVYGTFRFRGLEKSDLAGGHSLMDLGTFRELYGLMTQEKLRELTAITDEVGIKDLQKDDAEEQLFGGGHDVVVADPQDTAGFDEFEGITLSDERKRLESLEHAVLSQEEIDNGLALNAAIILEDPNFLKKSMAEIQARMDARDLNLQTVDWQQASGIVGQFIIVIRLVLYIAITTIFLVALVIINNSMVMATMERVKEVGTMRAMGAQRWMVLAIFLIETLALGLMAGALGAMLGSIAVKAIGAVGIPAKGDVMVFLFGGPRLFPELSLSNFFVGAFIILVVSILSTLYPALIATRIQPVTAMQARE